MWVKLKEEIKNPHPLVLMFAIVVVCVILTWILPAGQFERVVDEETQREIVAPGTYAHMDENHPIGPWGAVLRIFSGYINAADIIFFIIFAVAYVGVLSKIGAINALTGAILRKLGNKDILIIPIFMMLCGIGGTTFGMSEEVYGLIPVFMAIMVALGYDRIAGGATIVIGASVGFSAATFNPFTIGVASAVAEVDLVTPKLLAIRVAAFIVFEVVAIWWVMRYANKIRKDPEKSIMYGDPNALAGIDNTAPKDELMQLKFTKAQIISLLIFAAVIGGIVAGVILKGWYLQEIAGLFIGAMLVTCIVNKMRPTDIAEHVIEGAKSCIFAPLLIGLARSVSIIMEDGYIIDTVVNFLANIVASLPTQITAIGMLIVQNIVNFFIPSGSGQAVVMMPIMAPLADIVGQSREIAVLAFQFGDGFSNLLWPTAVSIQCGLMGIGLNKWYKFFAPLFGIFFLLECAFLILAINVGV